MFKEIEERKKCLFQTNRQKTSLAIFNLKSKPNINYRLIGDKKQENLIEVNFLNAIISMKNKSKSPTNKNKFSLYRTSNYSNNILSKSTLSKSLKESVIIKKKKTLSTIEKSKTINTEKKEPKEPKEINPIIQEEIRDIEEPLGFPDLLLNLYNKGMYDPRDPSTHTGLVKLTEKQKDKWKLTDYHPLVYANEIKNYHPFCFFYGTKYTDLVRSNGETRYPEGKLVNYNDWVKEPDYSLKGIYKGIEINHKVGLVIVDPNVKKKYSGLVTDIIIQLLKVPFGHHMCLNVKIFEPKCLEERFTNVFSYANKYLIPASEPSLDPYERFKLVITFMMSGLYIPAQQLKPFNPYLGETFQGELPNGAKIYMEQVTHKPLCVRFYMFYKKVYKLYGYVNFSVRSEGLGSTMYVCQHGPCIVEFPSIDEKVIFHVPEIKIVNARNEDGRANLYAGNMVFVDIKNNFKAVVQFDFNKNKFHDLRGCIFKGNFPPGYKYDHETEWTFGKKLKIDKKRNEPGYLDDISGSWITNLFIGNKMYWDIQAQIPEFIKPSKTCLPSDGRFREDLCWLWKSFYDAKNEKERKIYENISQDWKVLMEDFNRWDRKRRAEYNEKYVYKKS